MSQWDRYLIKAYRAAMSSFDPSTQNGAVLVNAEGTVVSIEANNFPYGLDDSIQSGRWGRPQKYWFVEHAERNAIYSAAFEGTKTAGLTMVCPWAACADCARAIVQAGISHLVRHERSNDASTTHERWGDTVQAGDEIMLAAGVEIIQVPSIPGYKLRRNEQLVDTADL